MDKSQLVVLQYTRNNCYIEVVNLDKCEHKVEVDLENMLWSYDKYKNTLIGRRRYIEPHNNKGVIGVYDRLNTEHLGRMVRDGKEATTKTHYDD